MIQSYKQYLDASDAVELEEGAEESGGDDGEKSKKLKEDGANQREQQKQQEQQGQQGQKEGSGEKENQGEKDGKGIDSDKNKKLDALKMKEKIIKALRNEVLAGLLEVLTKSNVIVIRILDKGSFPSASDELRPGFYKALMKIKKALAEVPGAITVAGHTDNIPISTHQFRSNWELSTARAVTVTQELLKDGWLNPKRFVVAGYGDSRPLIENDTPVHRSRNRRVEIVIMQSNQPKAIMDIEKSKKPEPLTLKEEPSLKKKVNKPKVLFKESGHEKIINVKGLKSNIINKPLEKVDKSRSWFSPFGMVDELVTRTFIDLFK